MMRINELRTNSEGNGTELKVELSELVNLGKGRHEEFNVSVMRMRG